MAETTTATVETKADDKAYLTFTISQDTYDIINELAERAGSRGLNDSVQFWLEANAVKHAKVQENLWDRADDQSIHQRAQKGNKHATRVLLKGLGLDVDNPDAILEAIAKLQTK